MFLSPFSVNEFFIAFSFALFLLLLLSYAFCYLFIAFAEGFFGIIPANSRDMCVCVCSCLIFMTPKIQFPFIVSGAVVLFVGNRILFRENTASGSQRRPIKMNEQMT